MAINDWWAGRPHERYWMEITDRDDVGHDVRAPQTNGAGGEEWSYTLVTYTQPGDIVLHWHKDQAGEAALIGWSEVVGPLVADSMDWLAHGTRGRARGTVEHVANWLMPLGGMDPIDPPITRTMLETRRGELLKVIGDLKRSEDGSVYPPFYLYGGRQLRAMQSYLTKFPAALVPIVNELASSAIPVTSASAPSRSDGTRKVPSTGKGRLQDPVLRKAVEGYAVAAAVDYYRKLGATNVEELGKPYDLRVHLDGVDRHIEVKGSTIDDTVRVVLTSNEVDHARRWRATDLFVLDGVRYEGSSADGYELSGGRRRVWSGWQPDPGALHPTEFVYDLPEG